MEKVKSNIVIIVFLIICVILTLIAYIINKSKPEEFKGYFVYSNIASYTCDKNRCDEIDNTLLDEMNLDYNIYINNKKDSNKSLKFGNVWNIFDSKSNYVSSPFDFFAYSGNFKVDFYDKNTTSALTLDDIKYIEDKLDSNLPSESEYTKVYNLDDDIRIIVVSNFNEDTIEAKKKYYTFAYIDINGTRSVIFKKKYSNHLKVENIYLYNAYSIYGDVYIAMQKEKHYHPDEATIDIYRIDKDKLIKLNK